MVSINVNEHYEFCMGDHSKNLQVSATIHFYEEKYGDDADGNRGIWQWVADDVTNIEIYYEDKKINDTSLEADFPDKFEEMLQKLIEIASEDL